MAENQNAETESKLPENIKYWADICSAIVDNKGPFLRTHYTSICNASDPAPEFDNWPKVDQLKEVGINNEFFFAVYAELNLRQNFARKGTMSVEERIQTSECYKKIFDLILKEEHPTFGLSIEWTFDIMKEFIYHYESHYETLQKSSEIPKGNEYWTTLHIIQTLENIVEKSNVYNILNEAHDSSDTDNIKIHLGFFALTFLHKVHMLTGDYYSALEVVKPLKLDRSEPYLSSPTCSYIFLYNLGVNYLMLRRYKDAVKMFTYMGQSMHLFGKFEGDNTKKLDKIKALLTIAHSLCLVQRVDRFVDGLSDSAKELIYSSQRGDSERVKPLSELYDSCFPTYFINYNVSVNIPPTDSVSLTQKQVLFHDIEQQETVPLLHSILKLYTVLPITQLAKLKSNANEDSVRNNIHCLKWKSYCYELDSSSTCLCNSLLRYSLPINFVVVDDTINVESQHAEKHYANDFIQLASRLSKEMKKLSQ